MDDDDGDDDDVDVDNQASSHSHAGPSAPRSVLPAIRAATTTPQVAVPSVGGPRSLSTPASKLAAATCSQSPPVRVTPLGAGATSAALHHRNVIQSV
ncbi:hypothetical protein PINS_up021524 [Pythium insidiosum]|nr:hypothetical protein PINS_up021524 [Pythium insidiosum]